ncbi:hypothetical protein NNC19_05115 [Clostridium sp. SHJSY1]|uniref:hypothetical protein n=1 Tax=Clostridium sp. SHJSY1 TaxID=2942483 RepID=UPI002875C3EB|nr:hypothetical protein [Clostridium sp. SHJSY1]MDS0525053.1 hypothetical protein [Clostridium sp. SHJSY1]
MNNLYIMKEIEKTMNFAKRKIYEGKLLIDILDLDKKFFVEMKNNSYYFYDEKEENEKKFKGILLLSENVNDLNEFKLKIKKIIWKLDSNGFIIIKYVNNENFDIDLKKEEFENFLKYKGFLDIESYIILDKKSNEVDSEQGLVIIARLHEELLKESPEYEEYTINFVEEGKCGGCSKKSGGCNGKKGSCNSCCRK